MTHALNLTLKIKQDAATQAQLKNLEAIFADKVQPLIEAALKKSRIVHFARVVVIGNEYIQVITEYEGSHQEYTEFFRRELTPVFAAIFSLADMGDKELDVTNPNAFFEFSKNRNERSLGKATDGSTDINGNPSGWLFSAYDHMTVEEILTKLGK
ncbi:hypothetical protein ABIE85_001994 [Bradyrhizobium diazoefficiens]|jgi:hypothetical protein|uniref:hypothetical protein n=1 Tax=Bradyrhizobium TaxID=374 RepID=UPI0013738773|nr:MULTISPECIES: hypothetical protein [Bradyrhizobium]MDA9538064.1 hypothetical protein [Bradyrhizobium sp. CCBAU 21362]QHP70476.1 hypothetical protein EI171_26210 [Bradyrhizobium sp. LCT2]WLA60777.1 hypothetical protein QIH81_19540 [Bradyrhizobium diazoefficiens]WLA61636.1 hypothetical protein QNN01_24080 [Bradyrhizobium diazoefficiens]